MKKYQQLILVTLSILSFISLLIYRHEYNKLRYVLEVFNFFGTPGLSSSSPNCGQNVSVEKYLMSEPLPAWQRVSNTLYIYSAYWETIGEKGHVRALAIGVLSENFNYGCYLWFESSLEPVKGQFRFSELPRKNTASSSKRKAASNYFANKVSKMKGFMFYCDADEETSIPVGVTFYKAGKDETYQAYLPVYKIKTDSPKENSVVICVLPNEYTYLKKLDYLEFLSFHRVIGIKDFIIYGGDFQFNIISPIKRDVSYDTNLMVLQWNYPFSGDYDLMLTIAENDCLLRTKGLFENTFILKWNQFFVPQAHSTAQNVISNLDPSRKISVFQFYPLKFCLEFKDDPTSNSSLPIIFRKSRFSFPKIDEPVLLYKTNLKNQSIKKNNRSLVNIHWYTKCDASELKLPEKLDRSTFKFKTETMESKLMQI